ncbi:winged helix-turn-helix domain-containing protein [Winogradskyella bathintestinalis]|uniref:LysR family transcriptional regulator n=1 Tax=Winogradskyella bathintestinalis TaxID=3035208 RepID=A0ABT7ZSA3_9FLAO|nr:LysR family transcriptional regulator [Winogradskyella bathintestinalis]MDN3491892.1 LysR family transcriptional regulator [Winogradskyella bathintestinalis]
MKVKSKIWIEKEGKPFIGYGRIKLLKEVDNTASISAAAKAMKMSYKKAWNLLNDIEALAEQPVLVKNIGGKNGGGSQVTAYGKSLILQFEILNENCIGFLEQEYKKLT